MSDETNAGERELLWEIKTANERIKELEAKLAEALAKWEQQNPPTVSGSVFAVDLDNPLAEGLVLECLDRKVLAATARHYHMKMLRWKGEALKRTVERDEAREAARHFGSAWGDLQLARWPWMKGVAE